MSDATRSSTSPHGRIVVAAIAVYVLALSWISWFKYSRNLYGDFDLAIHAQSVWNILHGSVHSSIHGISFLGNHAVFCLYLVAPLYALLPSPLLLLGLQNLLLGTAAWPLFLIARRELSPSWGAWLAIVYLVYPPLVYMNLYEFHPVALTPFFFLWMFHGYRLGRFRQFIVFLLLALSCQENISLVAIAFAFYAWMDGRRGRWVAAPLLLGIAWFVLTVFVVLPHFNRNTIQFYSVIYGDLGDSFAEVALGILADPVGAARIMLAPHKLEFLVSLFGPLGFTSLASPLTLVPDAIVAVQRLLAQRLSESSILYHYQAEFIAFVFLSAIYGIRRLMALPHRIARPTVIALLVVMPLVSFVAAGIAPTVAAIARVGAARKADVERMDRNLRAMPRPATIVATFEALPKLSNRRGLYSLHHVYSGVYTLSDVPYRLPEPIDYVVLDTADPLTFNGFYGPSHYQNLTNALANGRWTVADQWDQVLVLRRSDSPQEPEFAPIRYVDEPGPMSDRINQGPAGDLRLVGYVVEPSAANGDTPLRLYWRRQASDKTYDWNTRIRLTGEDGATLFDGVLSPGKRIRPPQSWEVGRLVCDRHVLRMKPGAVAAAGALTMDVVLRLPTAEARY